MDNYRFGGVNDGFRMSFLYQKKEGKERSKMVVLVLLWGRRRGGGGRISGRRLGFWCGGRDEMKEREMGGCLCLCCVCVGKTEPTHPFVNFFFFFLKYINNKNNNNSSNNKDIITVERVTRVIVKTCGPNPNSL